jgi:hypothetical protein
MRQYNKVFGNEKVPHHKPVLLIKNAVLLSIPGPNLT